MKFTTALLRLMPSSLNASTSSCARHLLAVVLWSPSEQAKKVDVRVRQETRHRDKWSR